MQLKTLDLEAIDSFRSVLLFTEDKPEDYVFDHLLSLVEDKNENLNLTNIKRYRGELPDWAMTTERNCTFESFTVWHRGMSRR